MVQAVDSTDDQLDWAGLQSDLESHEPSGWFTSQNYHVFFDLHQRMTEVQSAYEEIRSIRQDLLDQNRITKKSRWDRLGRRSREREIRHLRDTIDSLTNSISEALRKVANANVIAYNSVKTYVGRSHLSLSNVNNTVDEHPENRKEFCKVRIEYIRWCLTSTWSEHIVEEQLEPYLDGMGIDEEKVRSWLMKFEREVSNFLEWMYGFLQDVVQNLDTGLDGIAADVRDELMQAKWDEGNANWRDVKRFCELVMDDPDVGEFLDILQRVHDYGGSGREYIGLSVWVENIDEIERWEREFDDDYDRREHLDPDRPEPTIRVELLKNNEWSRADELIEDWDSIHEWTEELQLEDPEEPDEQPVDDNDPIPQPSPDVDAVISRMERIGVFDGIEGPSDTLKKAYRATFDDPSTPDEVAEEVNCPPGVAKQVLEKLVDNDLVERVSSLDANADEYCA